MKLTAHPSRRSVHRGPAISYGRILLLCPHLVRHSVPQTWMGTDLASQGGLTWDCCKEVLDICRV